MSVSYKSDLYKRIREELDNVAIIDCHEHLQRERELPKGSDIHVGRFFLHYADTDLITAGMSPKDIEQCKTDPSLTSKDRWQLIEPWYKKSWNTAYCEALRIAIRDLYGIEEFSSSTVDELTNAMRKEIKPGFTRKVFDKAGIDFALQNPFIATEIYVSDFNFDCFICDMVSAFTYFPIKALSEQTNIDILSIGDYLKVIDFYFERDAQYASALKIGCAYERTLFWEDVPKSAVEKTFNRLLAFEDRPDRKYIQALEDFILHYLCRKCGEYALRMKFHTGFQAGNGNIITNSRAALMANLFMKYPKTGFDIYHISYPYQEELVTISKNFPNVTIDFCWMWVINPAAARRALSDMLDAVPANKIHGFGGDYMFVEGTYGHAIIAKREIARVLCEKVEDGRFSEDYAIEVGRMLLCDNAMENFELERRREAFKKRAGEANT